MFAHGKERNIAQQDKLLRVLIEGGLEMNRRVFLKSCETLRIHARYPLGGFLQAFALRVFANTLKDEFDAFFDLVHVHCHYVIPLILMPTTRFVACLFVFLYAIRTTTLGFTLMLCAALSCVKPLATPSLRCPTQARSDNDRFP